MEIRLALRAFGVWGVLGCTLSLNALSFYRVIDNEKRIISGTLVVPAEKRQVIMAMAPYSLGRQTPFSWQLIARG